MTQVSQRKALFLLCGLGLASACGGQHDATTGIAGTYKLVGSLADTVPFVLQRDPLCVHTLHEGSATFRGDSLYSSTFRISHACENLDKPAMDDPGVKDGRYRLSGDTVQLYNNAGQFSGLAEMQGEDTLRVRGGVHTLIFVRQ